MGGKSHRCRGGGVFEAAGGASSSTTININVTVCAGSNSEEGKATAETKPKEHEESSTATASKEKESGQTKPNSGDVSEEDFTEEDEPEVLDDNWLLVGD